MIIEVIGIIASIFIVVSMCFKTTTFKGTIVMRIINGLGSIIFVIYGILLPAIATLITNACALVINLFYLIKEIKDHRRVNK